MHSKRIFTHSRLKQVQWRLQVRRPNYWLFFTDQLNTDVRTIVAWVVSSSNRLTTHEWWKARTPCSSHHFYSSPYVVGRGSACCSRKSGHAQLVWMPFNYLFHIQVNRYWWYSCSSFVELLSFLYFLLLSFIYLPHLHIVAQRKSFPWMTAWPSPVITMPFLLI